MLALTDYLRQDVLGARGERVGRVRDLAVGLDEPFPLVRALVVASGRRVEAVPWERVATFERSEVALREGAAGPPEQADELWLARDVLDHQVVDVDGRRLARVGEVELVREGDALRAVAVEIGLSAVLRRVGLRRLAGRLGPEALPWDRIHLASGPGHELQLRSRAAMVHRLGPEELMHLVGRLPVPRGAEVLRAVAPSDAAGALGASRAGVAAGLLRELGEPAAREILAHMPLDDAATALRPMPEAERAPLLAVLDEERASRIAWLLAHEAGTAGAIMTPDVRTAAPGEGLGEVRARIAANPPPVDGLLTVVVVDGERRPLGVIPVTSLVSGRGEPVDVPAVRTDTPLDEVLELFSTYDVLALPVVDEGGALVGAVAVDDLLDVMLAEQRPGGRRYEVMSARRRAPA